MITEDLLRFVREEKNISMEFVERAKARGKGVYLYGGGGHKYFLIRFLRKYGIKINAILDSFQQGNFQGIPIILFSDFLRSNPDPKNWFVISAPSAEKEIRKTLEKHFPRENIFSFEMTPYWEEWLSDVETHRGYLIEHWDKISSVYDELADEKSKETLVNMIRGRISGRTEYYRSIYTPDMYYPKDIIHLSDGEVLAEIGSFNGATLLEFVERCPDYKAAYCFEPDQYSLKVLNAAVEGVQHNGKIKVFPKGVWDCSTKLSFRTEDSAATSRVVEEGDLTGNCVIETVTLDEAITEPITYLRMYLDGPNWTRLKILRGGRRQITENRPKICVTVSLSWEEELVSILNYLRELVPDYLFYLRHHVNNSGLGSFLYAI